ncbi:MAG: family 43 glycosylhydrolase [Ruminococcus sp.]|nr:family 43 glycosylhydrolase [Ruminococcus sp.]
MSGTLYEVSLNIEGYRSNGSANVKKVRVYENYDEKKDNDTTTTEIEDTTTKAGQDADGYWYHSTFESSSDGWSGRGAATVETSSTAKFAGSKSLYVSGRTNSWNGASLELGSAFKAGETYSFSTNACYTSGSSDTQEFKLSLQYSDGSTTKYDQVAIASAPKGEWVQLANTSYTIPEGATDLQLYVETTDENEYVDFYIDEAIGAPKGTAVDGAGQPKVRQVLLGDLNFDEKIDSLDMITARKGLLAGGFDDSKTQKAADVDQNKKFETADLVLIQEYILKKITEFPVNKPEVDLSELASKFGSVSLAESWKKDNENNPLTTQRFGADPGWMVYDGRLYIYTTNDAFEYNGNTIQENSYDVGTINCISSADLVNWTDHGAIPVAGRNGRTQNGAAKWASCSWAPDAAWKMINGKPKFFLYFANSGGGIGVLTADSPTGPWSDPLGHALLTGQSPNCSDVVWMFDPGVYYDEETDEAYLFFGGGVDNRDVSNPKTGRCVKLGSDMISLDGSPQTMQTPYLFEDSSLIKIGDTWYYSYCANWNVPNGTNINGVGFGNADILYMTSKNPLGPWTSSQLKGNVFKNTGTQGIDNGGNNHHSIIFFKDKYYVAYHSRQQEMRMNGGKDRNYRSTQLNECTYNPSNGTLSAKGDMTGVKQIENLDPTQTVRASTMANESKGISVSGVGNTTVEFKKGEWAKVSQVDFSKVSSGTLKAKASSKNGAIIKVVAGSRTSGTAISYIEVPAGGSMTEIDTVLADYPSGASDIYFIANGDVSFDSWTMS